MSASSFAQDADGAVLVTPNTGPTAVEPTTTTQVHNVLGDLMAGPYDVVTGITAAPAPGATWNRLLGCARAWGYYWVSGGAGTTGAFMIHQYSLTGVYLQSFTQDVSNSTSTQWGARDLAVDEPNFKLWGGMENNQLKEYTFNPGAGANGTLTFTQSYTVPITIGVIRALTRNPNDGHFFAKNFNGALYEFTISPLAAVGFHNTNGKSTYGLAWNPVTNTMWQFDQNAGGPAVGQDGVEFNEIDTVGTLTGQGFVGTLYGVAATNIAGGCEIFSEGGYLKIVGLHQYTNDELNIYEIQSLTPPPTTYCTAGTSTNGCTASMGFTGTPSASATSGFLLTTSNIEGAKQGIHFYGINGPTASPWATGSSSFVCVKAPSQRMINFATGGTAGQCDGSGSTDFLAYCAANPGAVGNPLTVGQVFHAQAWYRDPPAPKTTNLSNGLQFTLAP